MFIMKFVATLMLVLSCSLLFMPSVRAQAMQYDTMYPIGAAQSLWSRGNIVAPTGPIGASNGIGYYDSGDYEYGVQRAHPIRDFFAGLFGGGDYHSTGSAWNDTLYGKTLELDIGMGGPHVY